MVDGHLRRLIAALSAVALAAGCAQAVSAPGRSNATATVLLAGDLMLGRGVAPIAAADPDGLFADVRRVVRRADVAAVNVESPLTERAHTCPNPHALEADPATAGLIAAAGFDVASVANNHAGDAGPESVLDSIDALERVDVVTAGGGATIDEAWRPTVVKANGLRVAFLSVDHSRRGLAATATSPGVAAWDESRVAAAVSAARSSADVVVVGIHGGIEYWEDEDPLLAPAASQLAEWGADVVWGHGPHVARSVTVVDPDGDGRPTVVATSLGNFLFDQTRGATGEGMLVEVLVDHDGVVAHRTGATEHRDLRVHFEGWHAPAGDAALVDGEWWTLDRAIAPIDTSIDLPSFSEGDVTAAAAGDLDRDGEDEYLVSYRHPLRPGRDGLPPPPVDELGRSAHLGVVEVSGTPVWLSRRPPHPIGAVAACDGSAAFAYTMLDDPAVFATGAGVWSGFGFVVDDELDGPASIGCADVDGDGLLEPVAIGR